MRLTVGESFDPRVRGVFPAEKVARMESLSALSKLLYWRLTRYAGPGGQCWPSQATLRRDLAVSESAIKRALADLRKERLIRTTRLGEGWNQPTRYEFLWHECLANGSKSEPSNGSDSEPINGSGNEPNKFPMGPEMNPSMGPNLHFNGSKSGPLFRKESENTLIRSSASDDAQREFAIDERATTDTKQSGDRDEFDRWFAEVWELYPRKQGDKAATKRKLRAKAKTRAKREQILAALKRQLPRLKADLQYCPYASTWFNGERWEDEVLADPSSISDGPIEVSTTGPIAESDEAMLARQRRRTQRLLEESQIAS